MNVVYSSAEIFSWKSSGNRTVLVVYGGPGEHHELAVSGSANATTVEGSGVKIGQKNGATILNWQTTSSRRVVSIANSLFVYILGSLLLTSSRILANWFQIATRLTTTGFSNFHLPQTSSSLRTS